MKITGQDVKEFIFCAILGIVFALMIGTCGVPIEDIIEPIPIEVLEFELFNGWTVYDILEVIFC